MRLRRSSPILLLILLAACAGDGTAPEAGGPLRPLNPGRWTPTAADLEADALPLLHRRPGPAEAGS